MGNRQNVILFLFFLKNIKKSSHFDGIGIKIESKLAARERNENHMWKVFFGTTCINSSDSDRFDGS